MTEVSIIQLPWWAPIAGILTLIICISCFCRTRPERDAMKTCYEKYFFPYHLALAVGYIYSNDPGRLALDHTGVLYLICAVVCLIFLFVVQVILARSFFLFIRDLLMLAATFTIGCGIDMLCKLIQTNIHSFLFSTLPTLAIDLIMGYLLQGLLAIHLIIWFIPTASLAKINREREARERRELSARAAAVKAEQAQEREDMDSPFSVHTMPDIITGPYNKTYTRHTVSAFSAEYISTYDKEIVTIHDSDIKGNHATIDEGYFYW